MPSFRKSPFQCLFKLCILTSVEINKDVFFKTSITSLPFSNARASELRKALCGSGDESTSLHGPSIPCLRQLRPVPINLQNSYTSESKLISNEIYKFRISSKISFQRPYASPSQRRLKGNIPPIRLVQQTFDNYKNLIKRFVSFQCITPMVRKSRDQHNSPPPVPLCARPPPLPPLQCLH